MTRDQDPVAKWASNFALMADLHARLAQAYLQIAEDSSGSSTGGLDPLGEREAECRSDPREPTSRPDPPMPITATAKPPLLLTQAQLCELLQVGPRTVRRLRSDPAAKFPAPIKRARILRWRREQIEFWIAGRRP